MKYLLTLIVSVLGSLTLFANSYGNKESTKLHGRVFDLTSHRPIVSDVNVVLYYNSDFIKDDSCKTVNGEFTASLSKLGWYIVTLSANGYMELTDTLWILSRGRATIEKDYYMSERETLMEMAASLDGVFLESEPTSPIEKPTAAISMNILSSTIIYFPLGKCTLTAGSIVELNALAGLLKENHNLVIEVKGHTDTNGPNDYNRMLSQWRAESVAKFLTDQGVDKAQLVTLWFGEKKPMNLAQTPDGRTKNRRVEFAQVPAPIVAAKIE